jgi:carbon storage regulator
MLVLTRKANQSVMIGDEVEVTVLAVMGDKVRLGIQAPREIPVFRDEVYLEMNGPTVTTSGLNVDEELGKLAE